MTKLVYIAGPYTHGVWEENVGQAIEAAETVWQAGHVPFIPHTMTSLWALQYPKAHGDWLEIDLAILERCDVMVRLPGKSEGADREEAFAEDHDIPVMTVSEFKDDVTE